MGPLYFLRSPKIRKASVVLAGVVLGSVIYLLIVQAESYRLSLSEAPRSDSYGGSHASVASSRVACPTSIVMMDEQYPKWWVESWVRSAVSAMQHKFVGDRPMFPPCRATPSKWQTYPFVERHRYLKNSKNPCWYEEDEETKSKELKCVPYFYLAGVAKGGTTDLAKRLRLHPELFHGTEKEYHWWERYRYGEFDPEKPAKTIDLKGGMSFNKYIERITGRGALDLHHELREKGSSVRIFGDFSPSYFWDPQNWYILEGNQDCTEPRVIVAQHIKHLFPGARILLTFRHPTPRLYSRFVSRIPRTEELNGVTPEDFHKFVIQGIQSYKKCFRTWSIRHCAYNLTLYREVNVRLVEGMYPVFMADWLRVWPRDQMHIMRYEDYGGHERERISEVLQFLGMSQLNTSEMDKLMRFHTVNSGVKDYKKFGNMLPKTKKVLDDFYQPFVDKLAELLQDQRFLWKDVPH